MKLFGFIEGSDYVTGFLLMCGFIGMVIAMNILHFLFARSWEWCSDKLFKLKVYLKGRKL